jgi:hypothetical protein
MSAPSPWICEACHAPITGGQGVVLIFNANPELAPVGSYPFAATPEDPPDIHSDATRVARDPNVATRDEREGQIYDDVLWSLHRRPNISFGAFCAGCHPYAALNPYEIPASASPVTWMAWVQHLHEKTWMSGWDLHRMLGYYFSNRDLEPGRFLG